jgi:hypothetical protein
MCDFDWQNQKIFSAQWIMGGYGVGYFYFFYFALVLLTLPNG